MGAATYKLSSMTQVSREKIALGVFLACIALIITGISWYLVAGHSWNYAATRIDDVAGEMEGYEIILYEGTAIPEESRVNSQGMLEFTPYPLSAALLDYQEKGALVHHLDVVHPERYLEPSILYKGERRIGVFSVAADETPNQIQAKVDWLTARDVNLVVAIAPAQAKLKGVKGIDAFIDLGETGPLSVGESSSEGYRIPLPSTGTVGVISISPSEVVSARALSH